MPGPVHTSPPFRLLLQLQPSLQGTFFSQLLGCVIRGIYPVVMADFTSKNLVPNPWDTWDRSIRHETNLYPRLGTEWITYLRPQGFNMLPYCCSANSQSQTFFSPSILLSADERRERTLSHRTSQIKVIFKQHL